MNEQAVTFLSGFPLRWSQATGLSVTQEKALIKFEDRESELPQMIQAHNNEVRSLREQLRRMREKYEKTDRYLRDAEDELESTKARLKKYKALSDQKELAERSELDRRLNKAELDLEEKQSKIRVMTCPFFWSAWSSNCECSPSQNLYCASSSCMPQ